ncbi:Bsu YqfO NIF3/CutA domain [uncultured Candidatus Thioglobus sp.]|nr:Bsu YqfO NIF3/CutA domain [uncultured Candidatus Thioglobus sp.]
MYRIDFYVPEAELEKVKTAMFKAGAGRFDNYKQCAWQTKGTGQFEPINSANPTIGNLNTLEQLEEYKVEILCTKDHLQQVLEAMKSAHSYEQVAYSVLKMEDL